MIHNEDTLVLSSADAGLPVIGWHNIVNTGNIDTTTEDADFPASNLASPSTYLKWKGGINTAQIEVITIDISTPTSIDYFAIAKHNFGTIGARLTVEINTNDSPDWVMLDYEDNSPPGVFPDDDCPLIFRFTPTTITGIRLTVNGGSDIPEAAVVYVGRLLQVERSIKVDVDHKPLPLGRRTKIVSGMSESGNFLGRVVLHQFNESVAEFSHITPDWYRANFDPFVLSAQELPFFIAWNPSEYPEDVGFAWLTSDPEPEVAPSTRRMSVDLNMRGISCV